MNLIFGDKCLVNSTLERDYVDVNKRLRAFWISTPIKQQEGIYIGRRSLRNGFIDFDPERGKELAIDEVITVYLIVLNEKENPIYVLPSEVKPL